VSVARTIGLLDTMTQLLGHQKRRSDERGRKMKWKEKKVKIVL
jgi:hypothetical protein